MKTPSTDRYKYRKAPTTNRNTHTDVGFYALAAAIVKQAVDEYRDCERLINGEIKKSNITYVDPVCRQNEIVKFFRSQWYSTLCDIDPQRILDKLGVRA